jgi:SP family general alpha glucoside:H+ symporter-like MFS transporter
MHTEAQEHVEAEAKMGLWKGIKTYPQAAAWSILLSSTVIMEGYDTSLIGSLFAYPTFAQKYGGVLIDGKWQVPTAWHTGLQNGEC